MATIYLRSTDGNDADDGSTWALAKATLAAALTAAGAGGTVYVSQAHAETQASAMTLTSPGTEASPVVVACVNDGAEPPTAMATTATVSTTGNNNITYAGVAQVYGVTFVSGSGANATRHMFANGAACGWRMTNCGLTKGSTNGDGLAIFLLYGSNDTPNYLILENSTITFGSTSDSIYCRSNFSMNGGSIAGSAPTTLFASATSTKDSRVALRGVDLSLLGSGKTLVGLGVSENLSYEFSNCKLGASVAMLTGTIANRQARLQVVNCDSADTNYRYYYQDYQGTIQHETTIIRTGGASDGTTGISRKMVSSANTKFYSPLVLHPITIWNETTGSSITATVEVVTDGVTLTDAEAWLEVEYLGTSGYPLSLFANDRAADILATPANQTTSSATWTTTGLSSPVKQKLSVSFTPQEKGPITFRVHLAKASTTMYVCPKVDIT